ncbi:MAG: TolC family protein [Caulobacterales bacterium]|nr:TolC family protein [Caulobacterales bacterium]
MRTCILLTAGLVVCAAAEPQTPAQTAPLVATAAQAGQDSAQAPFLRSLARAPAIQAAQERILAARRAAGAAGRLPDPMLGAGYARKSTSMDRWPMYDLTLEQPLPRWGERDAMRAKASAETAMSEADLQDMLGETAAEVATMLAEAEAARAKLAVVEGQITRATAIQTTIAARVAAGGGSIADQLGVQSRLAALAVERDTMRRMVTDAEQEVRGRLGLAPDVALPPFTAPDRAAIVVERVPGVLAAQAKSAEAEAMFQEARASRYPETAVGLRYEREQQPGDPMNTVGLEFRMSIPVWQGASEKLEDAAYARRRAARHEAAGWKFRMASLLGRAERATTVATTARNAAQETKTRLDAEYDSMLRSAGAPNGANMISVLDVLDRLSDAERMVIEAEATARQAEAGLWRLAPPDLSTVPLDRNQP